DRHCRDRHRQGDGAVRKRRDSPRRSHESASRHPAHRRTRRLHLRTAAERRRTRPRGTLPVRNRNLDMSTHESGEAGPTESGDQAPIITVVGATATGESDLALDLAEHLGGEIINTDSMQFYRGMDISTAKLPVDKRRGTSHHLNDILAVTAEANVQDFQARARTAIADIRDRDQPPSLLGRSALYVRAAVDHMEFPGTDPDIRARLEAEAAADRWSLHQRPRELDPTAAEKITVNDQRRIARALEVIELTGRAFSAQ